MRDMEDTIDKAARRTAINLMRLLENIDLEDAETYSQAKAPNGVSHRHNRQLLVRKHYRRWFEARA